VNLGALAEMVFCSSFVSILAALSKSTFSLSKCLNVSQVSYILHPPLSFYRFTKDTKFEARSSFGFVNSPSASFAFSVKGKATPGAYAFLVVVP
jgi:hypothetical protein